MIEVVSGERCVTCDVCTDEAWLARSGRLGAYRGAIGWGGGRTIGSTADRAYLFTAGMFGQPGHDDP
jgi:hypothetical protein